MGAMPRGVRSTVVHHLATRQAGGVHPALLASRADVDAIWRDHPDLATSATPVSDLVGAAQVQLEQAKRSAPDQVPALLRRAEAATLLGWALLEQGATG